MKIIIVHKITKPDGIEMRAEEHDVENSRAALRQHRKSHSEVKGDFKVESMLFVKNSMIEQLPEE